LSAEALVRRAAEDAECAKAIAAGRARLPFQAFVFWNAAKRLRTTVLAKTEAEALATLTTASPTPDSPAEVWKRVYTETS
jgi:anthranilate phosphoribosyltransferase